MTGPAAAAGQSRAGGRQDTPAAPGHGHGGTGRHRLHGIQAGSVMGHSPRHAGTPRLPVRHHPRPRSPPPTDALGERLPAHAPSGRPMVRSAVRPAPCPRFQGHGPTIPERLTARTAVLLAASMLVVRSFSTTSSGDLRAAASGRPRPPKTRRREPASTRPWPASASRFARRALETCTKTRTGRFRWPIGIAHGAAGVEGPQKVRADQFIPHSLIG